MSAGLKKVSKAMGAINTDKISTQLRRKGVDLISKKVLITNFLGSDQEKDLSEPPNCQGYGRVRHFRRTSSGSRWLNPLPIDPASKALGLGRPEHMLAQVFQNAVCNWRCWYCYVDFDLLSANPKYSTWMTAEQLVDLYIKEPSRPAIIDLSGGQPELTPEWIVWMVEALDSAGLKEKVYLWSDDNLSNDFLWKCLTSAQLSKLAQNQRYGRVSCFKGLDSTSFAYNTGASPDLFDRQFDLMARQVNFGFDQYAYVTFTTPDERALQARIRSFMDRLQKINEMLPLRAVPLKVSSFTPMRTRINEVHERAMRIQEVAFDIWQAELRERYSEEHLDTAIYDVRFCSV